MRLMSHGHHHHDSAGNLGFAFIINLIFAVIELVGGLYVNSLAILSDALHDLGDSLSLGLAYFLEKKSQKARDTTYSYGYRRFSTLGAIINSLILIAGSLFIVSHAIPRIFSPQPSDGQGMIILAILGVIFNGMAYYRTRDGHGHNEKMVSLHLLEDVLGWVAVLIGGVLIYYTGWYVIDAVLSVGISVYVMINAVRGLRSTSRILLQGIPDNIDLTLVETKLSNIKGIIEVHDLHVWSLDGEKAILTAHLVCDKSVDFLKASNIKKEARRRLEACHIHHCTLELEKREENCQDQCD